MPYSIKNFDEINTQEWDDFVENCPKSWLWHTSGFIKAKSCWHGHSNQSFGVYDDAQKLVGIFPLHLHLIENKILRIFDVPVLDNIGGWLVEDKAKSVHFSQILIDEFFKRLSTYSCSAGNINFSTASLNHTWIRYLCMDSLVIEHTQVL